MRIPVIAGNWKMNKTVVESTALVKEIKDFVRNYKGVEIVVCPPFTSLWVVKGVINSSNLHLGAQDMYWEERGAFTGEISPLMLKDVGCEYVILGHSERREYFKESSEEVAKKVKAAFKNNLLPIVCVGENLLEREDGKTRVVIEKQIKALFSEIDAPDARRIIVAYEPVWAIGTGKSANAIDANQIIGYIRELFSQEYGKVVSEQIKILYGGSVNPDNIKEFIDEPEIDGALVGGASLNALSFSQIVKAAQLF
ncbi:MAG: triose-phosphate isomerase [Candidatus Caldatribacteriota bacterium]